MRRICERPGCGRPVVVVYGMGSPSDASAPVLWLEAWDPDSGRAVPPSARGAVCQRHGDAMAPPRGWTLEDRREAVPRLFKPKLVAGGGPEKAPSAKSPAGKSPSEKVEVEKKGRRARGGDLPRPKLFTEQKVVGQKVVGQKVVGQTVVGQTVVGQTVVGQTVVGQTVVGQNDESQNDVGPNDAGSGQSAPKPEVADTTSEPRLDQVTVEEIGDEPAGPVDLPPDSTKPWIPFFDPDDDLGGALDATGPLLREAFRPRGSNRRRDDSVG